MKTYKDIFQSADGSVLIPFFVLGDPDFDTSFELIKTAIDAGADILELGIPFSDPIADGPTIQKADIRALEKGMNCQKAFKLIRKIKDYKDIPIGLLMYYNLVWKYGMEQFYADAAHAGVNSILIADLCVDDADEVEPLIRKNGLDSVYMVTPITTEQRKQKITNLCTGFIYTVSVLGVTGARTQLGQQIIPLIDSLKKQTNVPVCVGFGVSTADHARQLCSAGADGVIIGSAVVNIIEKNLGNTDQAKKQLHSFISEIKSSL